MIKAKTVEELEALLEKALKKAQKTFPNYQIIEFGFYRVESSKGGWYEIRAGRTEAQEFFIACTCRGALQEYGCYHAAVVFIIHQREAQKKIDNRNKMENAPYFSGGESSDKKPTKVGNYRV